LIKYDIEAFIGEDLHPHDTMESMEDLHHHYSDSDSNIHVIRRSTEPRLLLDQSDLLLASAGNVDSDVIAIANRTLSFPTILTTEEASDSIKLSKKLNDGSGLSKLKALELLAVHGPNTLPQKLKSKFGVFFGQLLLPMPLMIFSAAIVLGGK